MLHPTIDSIFLKRKKGRGEKNENLEVSTKSNIHAEEACSQVL